MSILYILIGFVLLVVGGEFLVRSSVAISFKFNISKMIIGLTVVSFATSLPELLVSLQAALGGFSDIALGNVIGSNIANIGLVLGITAIISALFIGIIIYVLFLIQRARKNRIEVEGVDDSLEAVSGVKIILWLIIGGVALYGGSELLVSGAVDLAEMIGVSERVISVSIIAVGTSVPELAASVIAALKKEKAISLGNLIGSNIFNIASVLGITALIQPIYLKSEQLLTNDIFWMLGFSFVLIPLAFLPKRYSISRYKGVILFVAYVIFIGLAFIK